MHTTGMVRLSGDFNRLLLLTFFTGWLCTHTAQALSPQLGDLNNDGAVDMLDLVILINHVNGTSLLPAASLPFADINDDGRITSADVDALADAILGLPPAITPKPVTLEPASGSGEVGVTVRPKVTFPKPIKTGTLNANNFYASFAGQKLPATIVPASDGTFAWLFLNPDMPSASQIQVTVDGSTIRTTLGLPVDAAGNGTAGSKATFSFSTVSVTPIPNTVIAGQIVDPGPDLKPRTGDDILFGPDGLIYTRPIEGVMVYILGMEDLATFTDANGYFSLNPVPVGDVKLVTDGRTATTPRGDFYWPEMVMDAHVEPGITNYWMFNRDSNGQIIRDANGVPMPVTTMYLPRIASNVLQTVSAANTTMITLNSNAAYTLPTNQQQYLTLEIMPHSLIGMDGHPMSTAQIGISVVPPELVRDMLPPGLLQHTFDITVQAPGIATFSTPARMTFPNVFNAPSGTKLSFLSFDHTSGRLVIDGTATVSADGLYVTTDPGTGVTHPGWHGLAPPGSQGAGKCGDGTPPPAPCNPWGILKDGSSLLLGGSLLVAGSELGWGFAVAASAASVASLIDDYFQNHTFDLTKGVNILDTSIGIVGATTAWKVQTTIADLKKVTTVYIPRDPILLKQYAQSLYPITHQAANIADLAGKFTGVLGGLLTYNSLKNKIDDCFHTSGLRGRAQPYISSADGYLDRIGSVSSNAVEAIGQIIGDKLIPLLPTNRFVILLSQNSNLRAVELDGTLYADPRTGRPFNVTIAGLVDDRFLTNVAFRDSTLAMLSDSLTALKSTVSETDQYSISVRQDFLAIGSQLTGFYDSLSTVAPKGPLLYLVTDALTGSIIVRGETSSSGDFGFFAPPNALVRTEVFDPNGFRYGQTISITPNSGVPFRVGNASAQTSFGMAVIPDGSGDSDQDGIPDYSEGVVGTDPHKFSTAGDGISDGAKVAQGLDPLSGRAFPTGLIASLALPGESKEVVLEGSTTNSSEQTAYVALGSRGLGIVNASQFQMPILVGQLDLPGDVTDVAVDSNLRTAAVAASAGGLHLVDVANPIQPVVLQTITGMVSQVEVFNGTAYGAFGAGINAYDLLTGELLETLALGGGAITGMAREGAFLCSMDSGRVLRVIDVSGTSGPYLVLRGSLTMPAGGGKLFVGNGIAYVCAANGTTGGFATADVSDPDAPTLIKGVDAANVEGGAIAVNGSGLAVTVGYVRGPQGQSLTALDVLNVANPNNTGAFLTRYPLPVTPFGVAIGAGIAFVADSSAGLLVVNYRSFDNQGISPTLIIAPPDDRDTNAPGLQAEEGSLITVGAQVFDDVQVRNVELLMNGQVVVNDVSFPWELSTHLPLLSSGTNMATLQVRATDTGGNVATSSVVTVTMIPDVTPPRLRHTFPNAGTIAESVSAVYFDFNEALNPSSFTGSSFLLVYAGPDNRLDTADDSVVTNGVLSYQASINAAVLSFASPLAYGLYRATVFSNIADLAGNRFVTNVSSIFYILPGGPTGDPDHDDLTNAEEIQRGTNPLLADTDGDGWDDGLEIADHTNPVDPNSKPQLMLVARPLIRLEIPGSDHSAAGLTLANPPVTLNVPSPADGGGFGVLFALPPVSVTIPASAGEAAGITMARPPLQLVLPDSGPSARAVAVVQPPVTVSLPSDAGGQGLGLWLAVPPLLVSLPSSLSAAAGVTVAQPRFDLFLPITANDASGVRLAMPPITVKFANGTSNLFFLNTPSPKGNQPSR